MHMTAKCVACRECEETCPADIPMAIQFRLIARDVEQMFGYETGASLDRNRLSSWYWKKVSMSGRDFPTRKDGNS